MRGPFGLLPFFVSVLISTALLVGCGSSGGVTAESDEEAYLTGMQAYESGKYMRAIEYLRAALDFGRSGDYADEAQFYLARAYYDDGQYLLAAAEYGRFADFYPTDARVEEAHFGRIQSYYQLSPRYNLDQSDTDRAIAHIRVFTSRYPQSVFTDEVVTMLEELREKLARKQLAAGALYERRELYEAAVLSYERLIERFPTSDYADDALLGVVRAQARYAEESVRARQAERYQSALDAYDRFVQLFPTSPLLRDAEALYDQAYSGFQASTASADRRAGR